MSNDAKKPVSIDKGILITEVNTAELLLAKFGEDELLIIKQNDTIHAIGAKCTHMGAPLQQGLVEGGQIRCPWHHARFCIKTGAAVGAPAFESLQRFKTSIRDGRLFIEKATAEPHEKPSGKISLRVVVIGAGAAGYACADMLVKLKFTGTLTIVNADPEMPYDRTICSKQYLAGKNKRDECFLPNNDLFAGDHGSAGGATLLKQTADFINVAAKEVVLDSGDRVAFDVLVLANGAEPERPALPGLNTDRAHVLRTLRDADAIIDKAKSANSVAILGASFIGLEAAASLSQRKLKVHVIAPNEVPLAKNFGEAVGSMVRHVHEQHGIVFHLGRKLEGYEGNSVTLDDGSSFDADFIVVGTGVKPRTDLAKTAGLQVASAEDGGGVVVNRRLETSAAGIFAIGDIARYPDATTGHPIRVEHWVHAQRQGQFVARAIMGASEEFDDVPFFWSAHFDTSLRYIGHVATAKEAILDGSIKETKFSVAYSDGDGGKALLTCKQDLKSLRTEAQWESTG